MNRFIFDNYYFYEKDSTAHFDYGFESGEKFRESISFEVGSGYNPKTLDSALFLAFIILGTSYYKTFPSTQVVLKKPIDKWQKSFFEKVYQEGLSQFAYENNLTRNDLANFVSSDDESGHISHYEGSGSLVLQSGGKDSLLVASMLNKKGDTFTPWYLSSGESHPGVLEELNQNLTVSKRKIDRKMLAEVSLRGAKNGHVPVTYINLSIAIIQAVLLNKSQIISSIAHEGEEPYADIGGLSVTHQWSKTWQAELDLAEYVRRYISPNIKVGSPIRNLSELRVAELFAQNAWDKYGHSFSSCNIANYKQGSNNHELTWCGDCPKCANSYILFAPFLPADELQDIFGGQDLFEKSSLNEIFKGLLGIDNTFRPFECIGETDELRRAYHMAQDKGGYSSLPFFVPDSEFDYLKSYPSQSWASEMLQ